MLEVLWNNRIEAVSVTLFAVGLATLLLNPNLIKKIIGVDVMDAATSLFLTSIGYESGKTAPIIVNGIQSIEVYVNPLPTGLVLTSIVVSVSVSAIMLALTYRIYQRYHTLDMNEIFKIIHSQEEQER